MLSVIGDAFIDILVPTDNIIPNGASSKKIKIAYGGTANVAVWASRLGEKVLFFGKVGDDALGTAFKKDLSDENVGDLTVLDTEFSTGICVSLIGRAGERTMITNRGANDNLKLENAKDCASKILESDILFFSGYSLISKETSKAVLYLMKKGKERKKCVCFNPGALNIISDSYKDILSKYCNILILNFEEGRAITGKSSYSDILKELGEMVDIVVLTMGEDGSVTCQGRNISKVPAKKVNVVDTTGAGDAFSAGFLSGRLRGLGIEKCSRSGHDVAAEVIQRFGAR